MVSSAVCLERYQEMPSLLTGSTRGTGYKLAIVARR